MKESMNGAGNIQKWVFFLAGSLISLAISLVLGIIVPVILIPIVCNWALIPYVMGGILILLLYYFYVVFAFSWIYEQFTKYKPDYWISSFYLLITAIAMEVILYFNYDILHQNPFSYWSTTKGTIVICCLIPAFGRILGVTLVGAFYTKID